MERHGYGVFWAALLALFVPRAVAQTSAMQLESLSVLPGVHVVVDAVDSAAQSDGLAADTLREDIVAVLREANIAVLSEPEWQNLIGNPALHLNLHFVRPFPSLYLYSGRLEVRQLTRLVRDSTKISYTRTWTSSELLGTTPRDSLPGLRGQIRNLVYQFVRAYEAAAVRRDRERDRRR